MSNINVYLDASQFQTTNAVSQVAATITDPAAEWDVNVMVYITGHNDATDQVRGKTYNVIAKKAGGTCSLVGAPVVITNQGDATTNTWSVSFAATSTGITISVQGATGVTVNWAILVQGLLEVS